MTCIVGLVDNGTVYIGADSATLSDLTRTIQEDFKIFKKKKFLIATSGACRLTQILRYQFNPPEYSKKRYKSVTDYIAGDFIEGCRRCLRENGFSYKEKDQEFFDGCFLVGFKDELFDISCDFTVMKVNNYATLGSGRDIALGVLYSVKGSPEERITKALEAAAAFNVGVAPPFKIMTSKD